MYFHRHLRTVLQLPIAREGGMQKHIHMILARNQYNAMLFGKNRQNRTHYVFVMTYSGDD